MARTEGTATVEPRHCGRETPVLDNDGVERRRCLLEGYREADCIARLDHGGKERGAVSETPKDEEIGSRRKIANAETTIRPGRDGQLRREHRDLCSGDGCHGRVDGDPVDDAAASGVRNGTVGLLR